MCSLGGVMKHLGYPESITTNERENGGGLREMKPEMHDGWGMHDPRQEGTGDREAYLAAEAVSLSPWWSPSPWRRRGISRTKNAALLEVMEGGAL